MSKKDNGAPIEAEEYLSEWCNGKIAFEDALRDFARRHVIAATNAVAHSIQVINPLEEGGMHGAAVDLDAYPLSNIK